MTANKRRFSWGAVLLVLLAMCLVYYLASGLRSQDAVSYAQVRQLFLDEKVQEFAISDTRLTAKLSDGSTVSCDLYDFQVFYDDLNDLVQQQHDQGIIRDYTYHADHSTNCAANASHHSQSDTHIGKLPCALIFRSILCHIESSLLLVGIAFLHSLGGLCLRIDNNLLRLGLCVDHIGLLFQLCLGYIGILSEMQLLEFFILRVTVRLDHRSNIESFELYTVIKKIGNQSLLNVL